MTDQMRRQILVAEDDDGCRFVYEELLGLRYDLTFVGTVRALRERMTHGEPTALLIADLKLEDGLFLRLLDDRELMRRLTAPFAVVSSVDDRDVLRLCFDRGASDYWVKPLKSSEVVVKIERLVRTTSDQADLGPSFPELTLDLLRQQLRVAGHHTVPLTPSEARLVAGLTGPARGVATPEALRTAVWGKTRVGRKALDTHLTNLRQKLRAVGFDVHLARRGTYGPTSEATTSP